MTKAIVPKWKYYTAAASPAIAVLVWTVVILNNQYMKEMTEKYFPGYGNLLLLLFLYILICINAHKLVAISMARTMTRLMSNTCTFSIIRARVLRIRV